MKRFDLVLFFSVLFLILFGLFMLYDTSTFVAFKDFGDKFYYVRNQSLWVVLGVTALLIFSFFDYHKLINLALPALVITLVSLILVFAPGIGVKSLGAHRWINLKLFLFQPSEFAKLSLAIYLAVWFSNKEKYRLLSFMLLLGLVVFLVIIEPDMGTAIVILGEAMSIYFLSGANLFYFMVLVPGLAVLTFILAKIEPYRAARLASFFSSNQSVQHSSYQVKQILISLGSGGLTGVGIGNSLEKYSYLPESTTDSIFAIIAEEIGFIWSVCLIGIFVLVIWRGFNIAIKAKDIFGRLLAGGITTFLAIQILVNLAAQTNLLPLTGIPLPFISYGGSALLIDLCSVGILLNISRQIN